MIRSSGCTVATSYFWFSRGHAQSQIDFVLIFLVHQVALKHVCAKRDENIKKEEEHKR